MFTHMHIFWIAGLLLALIEFPDFSTLLKRIAGSTETIAGIEPGEGAEQVTPDAKTITGQGEVSPETEGAVRKLRSL